MYQHREDKRWVKAWSRIGAAALLLVFAVSVSAAEIRVPGGTPPADSTTWILVSKPPKRGKKKTTGEPGVQLHAQGTPDGRFVSGDLNPTTGATGDIRDPHKGECECIHYHGTLFGKSDPKRGARCGWGCVVRFDLAPDSLAFLSGAVMFEERADKKSFNDDVAGAIADLEAGIQALRDALESEPSVGTGSWDPRDSREYQKALNDAIELDEKALEKLMDALDASGRARDRLVDKAGASLSKAINLKRKMVLKLTKELKLLTHD